MAMREASHCTRGGIQTVFIIGHRRGKCVREENNYIIKVRAGLIGQHTISTTRFYKLKNRKFPMIRQTSIPA
jgi:coenzyme F420-reducing hydrogenase delta subunit